MRKLPAAAKVAAKLLVGFGVVALVLRQVEYDDALTIGVAGGASETVVGRGLKLDGDVVLSGVLDAAGAPGGVDWSSPIAESQVEKKDGLMVVTRRGADGKPEIRSGASISWSGTATLREAETGIERTFPMSSVLVREEGKNPVRVFPDAKRGLVGIGGRLFDRPWLVFGAMAFLLWAYVTSTYRWTLLLRSQELPAGFLRCFRLTFIGFFFNNVLPGLTGGDLVKAVMIARDHPEYRARAVGTVIVDRILGLLVLALISGAVLIFHLDRYREASVVIFGFLGAVAVAAVVLLSRRVRRGLGLGALLRRMPAAGVMQKLDQAFYLYRSQRGTLVVACGLSFLAHVGNIGAVYCFGLGVGLDRSAGLAGDPLAAYVATVPVAMIVSSIPLLPGGWGVGEAAFAYFFRSVGVWNLDLSIALSVVQRTAALAWSLLGGVFFFTHRKRTLEALHQAEAADAAAAPGS